MTQYISQYLDTGIQIGVLYTDFSKAFVRLDHALLLNKLQTVGGFSQLLINFFKSYLNNRTQYVEYRGHRSIEINATSGVPQGSILGPLLFVLFINNIVVDLNVDVLLYADDVKLFSAINTSADCKKLQDNLLKIQTWCDHNDLPLNVDKCNVISFSRKKETFLYDYKLDLTSLKRVEVFKDLGVLFDNKLTFNRHVEVTVLSANKSLGFVIRNSSGFTDTHLLTLLFNSFVKSKLEYASLIWHPGYVTYSNMLESIQRRFLKFLSYKVDGVYPPIGYPHDTLLDRFSTDSLNTRRKKQAVIFLHKLINNKINCPEITEKLLFHVPRANTRHHTTFYLARPRTNILNFSPLHFMCNTYNDLQDELDIFHSSVSSIKRLNL